MTGPFMEDPPIYDPGRRTSSRTAISEEVGSLPEGQDRGQEHGWPELEAQEREKTGIKNLKIKYNKVFGYYLEVTNSYKDMVPDYFMRKQTLTNAERYITPELKELEDMILGAEEKLTALEYDLFCERAGRRSLPQVLRIQKTAKAMARIGRVRLPGLRGGAEQLCDARR